MRTNQTGRRPGFSLVEVMTVGIIMGVLASFTVPRFSRAMEQSRANIAVANFRAIWTAQRAYRLQNVDANGINQLAPDLETLRVVMLIDRAIVDDPGDGGISPGNTYVYQITQTDSSTFLASARRVNSTLWVSTLTIDSNGDVGGSVQHLRASGNSGNEPPIDQFFQ